MIPTHGLLPGVVCRATLQTPGQNRSGSVQGFFRVYI